MPDKEELRGALARGYCSKRNKHKVLDPDLIEDMVTEVYASQQAEQETLSEEEIETILTYYGIAGRPEIAKALVGKIPCNGSGRIGVKFMCPTCHRESDEGVTCNGKEPHFNSMAELKRKWMEATDREARYREALEAIAKETPDYRDGYSQKQTRGMIEDAKTALNEGKD